jgi:hypothetical protein
MLSNVAVKFYLRRYSTVPKPSNAVFSVKDPAEVLMFLNHIADLADKGLTKSVGTASTAGAYTRPLIIST